MWERWFRFWRSAIFWWVPRSREDEGEGEKREAQPAPPEEVSEATRPTAAAAEPSPPSSPDDLTAIKGLGPAMQRKLAEVGITTFADLASADAQALTDRLKPSQRTLTKDKVQGWIDTARERTRGST